MPIEGDANQPQNQDMSSYMADLQRRMAISQAPTEPAAPTPSVTAYTHHTNTASTYPNFVPATPVSQPTPSQVKMNTTNNSSRFSWIGGRSRATGSLSRAPTAEALQKAMAKMTELLPTVVETNHVASLVPIDNSRYTGLAYSGICVVIGDKTQPQLGMAHYTFILEDSGDQLQPRVENFRGNTYEVQRLASDTHDEEYFQVVTTEVGKRFPGVKVTPMDAMCIPRGFNWEDKDSVRQLLLNGVLACVVGITSSDPTFEPVALPNADRDTNMAINLRFNSPAVSDYAGLPVRSDITMTLVANAISGNNQQSQSVNTQDRQKPIARCSGYIDMVWDGQQQMPQYGMMQQMPQPKFVPRFVVTDLENVFEPTLEAQILAIASSLVLRENYNYFPYFDRRPQMVGGRQVDIREVGALNIEANTENPGQPGYGAFIDTRSASFTTQDLGRLLSMLFKPTMLYSLRVSECGSDSWYNGAFKAASNGDQGAINAIITASDHLTGGNFSRIYNSNESPVVLCNERVHMGYYIGADGAKHDLSEIDYLAVMNLQGKNDPTIGAEWTDTFLRTDLPMHQRLSARRRMIESLVHSDVTYTGFGRLVTFTARYLDAIGRACAACGLDIRTINPSVQGDFFSQRATASFLAAGQMQTNTGAIYGGGYGAQPQFNNQFGWSGGRAY